MQMDDRVPAARTCQQIAFDGAGIAVDRVTRRVQAHHLDATDVLTTAGIDHRRSGDDLDLFLAHAIGEDTLDFRSYIDQGRHLDAMIGEIKSRLVGTVVVGEHHRSPTRRYRVAIDVGRHRRGGHDSRAIIIREHQRAFDGTGCQHHLAGAHAPLPLTWALVGRSRAEVVGHALDQRHEPVMVMAERRGPRQERNLLHGFELLHRRPCPFQRRLAIKERATGQHAAAKLVLLITQDHARATPTCFECCSETGGSGAHDHHVGMRVLLVITIRIGPFRRLAETGRLADSRLVDVVPERLRPHEGLVVEAGRQQRREQTIDRRNIEADAGPAIDAADLHAMVQLGLRGTQIRDGGVAGADLHQRIGAFRAGAHDAARPMQLEAAADQVDAVRKQRGCQGIALETLQLSAIECENQRPITIHATAGLQAMRLAHCSPPGASSPIL